jgi:hypothetical protein
MGAHAPTVRLIRGYVLGYFQVKRLDGRGYFKANDP